MHKLKPAHQTFTNHSYFTIATAIVGILVGIVAGVMGEQGLILVGGLLFVLGSLFYFFSNFEQMILGLFVLRSSLDIFSALQIPAAFALGMDALMFIYIGASILTKKPIETDRFWWVFAIWVGLQGLWVILLPLGGLGQGASALPEAIREWVRLFSWLMGYLMIMQLKGKMAPEKVVSVLLLALISPVTAATMQMVLPASLLPSFLIFDGDGKFEVGSRINGTLGHASTFSTFLILFIALTYWKLMQAKNPIPWMLLLGLLAFFLVSTKALAGLTMIVVFTIAVVLPRLNFLNLIGTILFFGLVLTLFVSSDYGRERLGSLYSTPLFNPEINWSRAILLSWFDGNSFNWRIAQWTFLIDAWRPHPLMGNGLATSNVLTRFPNLAHNDYVRALAEQGIVGLTLFISFIFAQAIRLTRILRSPFTQKPQRDLCFVMLAFLVSYSVGMCSENILSHTTLFFYWWLMMAVVGWNWSTPDAELELSYED